MRPGLTKRGDSQRQTVEARVFEATEALLGQGTSFGQVTVEQIATRAGISRPAFYFYFRDKRDLLRRLTADVSDLFYAEAQSWWNPSRDGIWALRGAVERVLTLYSRHSVLLRAVSEAATYDADMGELWRGLMARFVSKTRERIELEQAAGAAPRIEAAETAFALVWMTERACYQRAVEGEDLSDPRFVDSMAEIWLRSVYGHTGSD